MPVGACTVSLRCDSLVHPIPSAVKPNRLRLIASRGTVRAVSAAFRFGLIPVARARKGDGRPARFAGSQAHSAPGGGASELPKPGFGSSRIATTSRAMLVT
jgi:hypothetical protein